MADKGFHVDGVGAHKLGGCKQRQGVGLEAYFFESASQDNGSDGPKEYGANFNSGLSAYAKKCNIRLLRE